jgi:2-C-methyl-D-erythritol 4-phosphate cytidylyltransferase
MAAVRAGADGVIPAVAVTDTIKRVEGQFVAETVDRSTLVAVQTPQAFRAQMLRDAHATAGDATDDAGLVESIGGKVVVVEGDRWNLKLTTPEDLVVMKALLAHRGDRRGP